MVVSAIAIDLPLSEGVPEPSLALPSSLNAVSLRVIRVTMMSPSTVSRRARGRCLLRSVGIRCVAVVLGVWRGRARLPLAFFGSARRELDERPKRRLPRRDGDDGFFRWPPDEVFALVWRRALPTRFATLDRRPLSWHDHRRPKGVLLHANPLDCETSVAVNTALYRRINMVARVTCSL